MTSFSSAAVLCRGMENILGLSFSAGSAGETAQWLARKDIHPSAATQPAEQ